MVFAVVIIVVVIIIFITGIYFSQQALTGSSVSVDGEEETIVKANLFDKIDTPEMIEIVAKIGEDSEESFDLVNGNDGIITVTCSFPDFQAQVPASLCLTSDRAGNFVGDGKSVEIFPGEEKSFTISVHPFDDIRIKRSSATSVIIISEGEYNRDIFLTAWIEETGQLNELRIPIRVMVEE